MDPFPLINEQKLGIGMVVLLAAGVLAILFGGVFLFVDWMPPSTPYGACHSSAKVWLGCVAGLSEWLPFALLFFGVGAVIGGVWWSRK